MTSARAEREALWSLHNDEFRDPAEVVSYWQEARRIDPRLLEWETSGRWWEVLAELRITLLVTREYEHLVLAMCADETGPTVSVMRIPHPSGLTIDRTRGVVHIAVTRNPNQIFDLMPVQGLKRRLDTDDSALEGKFLVPVRTRFLPGCLYIHDLAMVGGRLHANSVGENSVVVLGRLGGCRRVWWPKCIETDNGPIFGRNHLQLNSIAAGDTIEDSFFSASTDEITEIRPGNPDFPVNGRGVIFSGKTGQVIARGLTRPHSARFFDGRIWVDNSGFGEVGLIDAKKFLTVTKLPGWTRGLCFHEGIAFVGSSRVLQRFESYAPGLDPGVAQCGVYAIDAKSGEILGSIVWPFGSQIFAVEWVPCDFTSGFPFRPAQPLSQSDEKLLFYSFQVSQSEED